MGVEFVAVSICVQVVMVLAFALRLECPIVEGEDVAFRTGPLLVKLVTVARFLVVVHRLK